MAGQQEVLREYLLSLGFKINTTQAKEFSNHLDLIDGAMLNLGGKLVDAGERLVNFVNDVSSSAAAQDQLAKRTRTSVKELAGFDFAAKQLNLNSGALTNALVGLSDKLALPGWDIFIKSLGVKVDGQTPGQILTSLLNTVQQFSPAMQNSIWSAIGADPNEMRLYVAQVQELNKALGDSARITGDLDAQNATLTKYKETWDKLANSFKLVGIQYASSVAPVFEDISNWLSEKVLKISGDSERPDAKGEHTLGGFLYWLRDGFSGALNYKGEGDAAAMVNPTGKGRTISPPPPLSDDKAAVTMMNWNDKAAGLRSMEIKYGLPSGILQGILGAESSGGKDVTSPAGAEGPFQFMPEMSKKFGIDPHDFGQSADAAAHFVHDLLAKYNNNIVMALQAYNIGETQFNKFLHGERLLPKETADYPGKVFAAQSGAGVQVAQNNTTNINVHGAEPAATAEAVADAQARVHADQVRNMGAFVR